MKYRRLFVNVIGCMILTGIPLAAQDITVSNPAWFDAKYAEGDHPPEFRSKASPKYPDKMGAPNELGYVCVSVTLDEKGNRSPRSLASDPIFELAVDPWLADLRFRPATKAGEPVKSSSWFAVLFNPKTAGEKRPDATPRLLAVAPAIVSPELIGNPIVLDTTNVGFNQGAIRGVLTWKFTPGTEGGQPIKMKVQETIAFYLPRAANPNQLPLATKDTLRTIGDFLHYDARDQQRESNGGTPHRRTNIQARRNRWCAQRSGDLNGCERKE